MNHPTTAGYASDRVTVVNYGALPPSEITINRDATLRIGEGREVTILLGKGTRVRIEEAGE